MTISPESYNMFERFYTRVGLPSVLLVVVGLAYFGVFSSPVSAVEKKLDEHLIQSQTLLTETQEQTRLLKTICRSLAKPGECL